MYEKNMQVYFINLMIDLKVQIHILGVIAQMG